RIARRETVPSAEFDGGPCPESHQFKGGIEDGRAGPERRRPSVESGRRSFTQGLFYSRRGDSARNRRIGRRRDDSFQTTGAGARRPATGPAEDREPEPERRTDREPARQNSRTQQTASGVGQAIN